MAEGFPTRIGYAQALRIVREAAARRRLPAERVATRRADGRIVARDLAAPIALPSFDNSRMDGYAVRHADLRADAAVRLVLAGEQFAGAAMPVRVDAGQCMRITTGAPIPAGADTVVIRERVREDGDAIVVEGAVAPGADIRRIGEDVAAGETVLRAGDVLTPARLGLLAALGVDAVEVSARPTVAVFTTGDELVEPGLPLQPGQIYNGNRELLMALLRAEGLEPTAWPALPDDPARLASQLGDAASAFDVVITCGGVSAGQKDHLPELLRAHGRIDFWKVRMKPGMPVLCGQWDSATVLALPGNPVSALATFLALGRPLLDGLQGRAARARRHAVLATAWRKTHERHEFLRGGLHHGDDGRLLVRPHPADASHQLRAAADSDALIVLEEGLRDHAAGDVVEIIAY